jgi:hypothetical protein
MRGHLLHPLWVSRRISKILLQAQPLVPEATHARLLPSTASGRLAFIDDMAAQVIMPCFGTVDSIPEKPELLFGMSIVSLATPVVCEDPVEDGGVLADGLGAKAGLGARPGRRRREGARTAWEGGDANRVRRAWPGKAAARRSTRGQWCGGALS